MKKFKSIALLLAIVLIACSLCACRSKEALYTEELKNNIFDKYGFPDVDNFFEYTQLKEIYEMRDNPDLICYWYTKNDMTGKWIYQGTCIGYGIPYGASITSPEAYQKIAAGIWGTQPMAEPNGLYTDSVVTTATWILTTNDAGDIVPTYVESEITVSQIKLDTRLCEDWSIPSDY
ncbi:MAG: hypothetical protein NC131_12435 [Roseburia sp.]|nr:hypothetical protein [Roseburia sp.]